MKNNRVLNVMESIVDQAVRELGQQRPNMYHCDQCVLDIKAIALNRIAPKYVVSHKGEVFSKVSAMANQYMTDVYRELSIAISIVSKDPHCDTSKEGTP
jgi:competence protein ComFB